MALAVIPCRPHSRAAVRVSAAMPALAALYSPRPASPRSAASDTMLMMRPQPRAAMCGRGARAETVRVVDEHVDAAPAPHRLRDDAVDVFPTPDVRHLRERLAAGGPDLQRGALRAMLLQLGDAHPRPRAREHERDPPPDALAGAGDERDPTGEPVHRVRRTRRAGAPCASSRCLRGSLRRTLTLRLVRGQATARGRTARSLYGKRSAFFVVRRLMVACVHCSPTRSVTRMAAPSVARRLTCSPCARNSTLPLRFTLEAARLEPAGEAAPPVLEAVAAPVRTLPVGSGDRLAEERPVRVGHLQRRVLGERVEERRHRGRVPRLHREPIAPELQPGRLEGHPL